MLIFLKKIATHRNYKFVLKNYKDLIGLEHINSILESKIFSRLIEVIELDTPMGKSITVIAPHTDDDIFGAGGTLLKAAAQGAKISVIYLSNSAKTPLQAKLVKQEAIDVCNCYGANAYFLDLEPNNIPVKDKTVAIKLGKLLKKLAPKILFISFILDDHDDHRRANQLFINSIDQVDFSGVEVWAYQIYSTLIANVVVDITNTIDKKISLIEMWKNVQGNRDWKHYILGINMMNCRYLDKKGERYAETFFVLPAKEYIKLCKEYFSAPSSKIYNNPKYLSSSNG